MNFIHVFLVLFGIGIQPGSNPVGLVVRGLAEENLEKQRECLNEENTAIFLNLDDDFHELICSLSLCPMTWEVLRSVKGHMDRIRYLSMGNESPIAQLISEHEEIFEALKSKNFDHVVELLKHHLYEIMQTHISIRAKNSEWFEEEDE